MNIMRRAIIGCKVGWDVSTASYDNKNFSVSSQGGNPHGVFFSTNGTKMYVVSSTNDTVYQYTLSTAWDVSSASYASKSFSVSSQDSIPTGVFFKSDGTKMYIVGDSGQAVYQYSLSTTWDVSTASYDNKNKGVGSEDTDPRGVHFSEDGTKMYVMGYNNDTVYQYTLSTAWDVSTASYASKSFSVSSQEGAPHGVFFSTDGTKLYIVGSTNDTVYQYTLSTAWDVSTASYESKNKNVSSQDSLPTDVFFKSDGTKMYIMGYNNDTVYQYSVS